MIPPEKIDEILARTDILSIIGQYVTLKRAGKNFKGLCPFHNEKTPSFSVNPEQGFYKCFGCGEGGGALQFLMKIENLDFMEAVKILASRAGVTLTTTAAEKKVYSEKDLLRKVMTAAAVFYNETLMKTPMGREAREYLHRRGVDSKTIETYQLGFAPATGDFLVRHLRGRRFEYPAMAKAGIARRGDRDYYDYLRNRVIFPICDSQGRTVALGGRGIDKESVPKYLNTPDSLLFHKSDILYGLHQAKSAIRSEESAVVVEGYMDAVTLHRAGIANVVASMGTSLTQEQARIISRYTGNIIFAYDADSAGSAATARGIEIFEQAGLYVKVVSMPQGEDPDSIIRKKGPGFFRELMEKALSIIDYRIDLARRKHNMDTPEGKQGFVQEIVPVLNEVRGSVRRAEYIRIISGRHNISEEILYQAVKNLRVRKKSNFSPPVYGKKRHKPEELLLAYLFSNPRYIEICREHDFSDENFDPDLLYLYRKLKEADLSGVEVVRADLLSRISRDENMLKKAVDLSMLEGLPACNEEEIRAIMGKIEEKIDQGSIENLKRIVSRKIESGTLLPDDPDFLELQQRTRRLKIRNE